jgi:PAS domain S-box-containing protein
MTLRKVDLDRRQSRRGATAHNGCQPFAELHNVMRAWADKLSIKGRIFLLAAIVQAPAVAFLAWMLVSDFRQSAQAAWSKVDILVEAAADDLQHLLQQGEVLMARTASRPLLVAPEGPLCDPFVVEAARSMPGFVELNILDGRGRSVCAAGPGLAADAVDGGAWFKAAWQIGSFMVSDVAVQPATGWPLIRLCHPIHDKAGRRTGLLVFVIDLLKLNRYLFGPVPASATITVVDPSRTVLLRSTEPDVYIGSQPPATDVDPFAGLQAGHRVATGRDGVLRMFSMRTLPGTRMRVAASLPEAVAMAESHQYLQQSIAVGLGVLLLSAVAGWRVSAGIVKPIARLEGVAAEVAFGRADVRSAETGPPELRDVARQFNQMLDARLASEDRLRGILESANDGIMTTNAAQVVEQANPAAARMFGLPVHDMVGSPLERFIPERFRPGHHQLVQAFADPHVASTTTLKHREVQGLRADGTEFPIEASISISGDSGHRRFTVIHRDITDRRKAQDALLASKQTLEAALASMSDAVSVSDTAGRFTQLNDACATFHRFPNMVSCPHTSAACQDLLEMSRIDGAPVAPDQWPVARALGGERASGVEYVLRRRDSGEHWIGSYSFAPIRDGQGVITGAVVVARDITAAKEAQADLEDSHQALQQLIAAQDRVQEDERSRIARELHDDLQQSLAAIRIDLGVLAARQAGSSADDPGLLGQIDALAEHALMSTRRIVDDLRPQVLEDLGLVPALQVLVQGFARRSGVAVTLDAPESLGDSLQSAPELANCLFRVTQEALNNVTKHARASRVLVRLAQVSPAQLSLSVLDDGRGIRQRDLLHSAGFGLRGMTERVRVQGGTLRVEPARQGGTLLEVLVPFDPSATPARDEPDAHRLIDEALNLGLSDPLIVSARPDPLPRLLGRTARHALQSAIDALDAGVAVVDDRGVITLVNRVWNERAEAHGQPGARGMGPGVDYLAVCRNGAASDRSAAAALDGLQDLMAGRIASFSCDYECNTRRRLQMFRMHAGRMVNGHTLISHTLVSVQTQSHGDGDGDG